LPMMDSTVDWGESRERESEKRVDSRKFGGPLEILLLVARERLFL